MSGGDIAGEVEGNSDLLHIFNRELNLPLIAEALLSMYSHDDDAETAEINLPAVLGYDGRRKQPC